MTKARSQQPVGRALRQPGNANTGCVDGADVCELLLAELQARRQRLRKLLRLVWMEVEAAFVDHVLKLLSVHYASTKGLRDFSPIPTFFREKSRRGVAR